MADTEVVPAGWQVLSRLLGGCLTGFTWHRLTGEFQLLDDLVV